MVQCAIEARWDEFVSLLQFALNSALVARHHDGMSLLFFVFGRQAGWPAAVELPATSLDPLSPWPSGVCGLFTNAPAGSAGCVEAEAGQADRADRRH